MKILYYILFLIIFNPILLKDKRDIHYPTYGSLFMPTKLGTLSLKSHFIRSAPGDYVNTEEGYPTKALDDIYEKLCKTDIGLLITSSALVSKNDQFEKGQLKIYDDASIPYYQKFTEKIHHFNQKIILSLVHIGAGKQAFPETAVIIGPSAVKHPISGFVPKEMTKEDIINLEENFANAALRAKKSNFDGIEIHSAQGGLLSQFLTPYFNRRNDEYGGSIENRARLLREIVKKVKEKCGKDFPILIKINGGDEMGNDGMTVDEFIEVGRMLENDGGITAIEISGNKFMLKKPEEKAYYREPASRLADTIKIPVILTGGIRDKETIDDIYKNTNVKFFGICRPFIQDPKFLEKLK